MQKWLVIDIDKYEGYQQAWERLIELKEKAEPYTPAIVPK